MSESGETESLLSSGSDPVGMVALALLGTPFEQKGTARRSVVMRLGDPARHKQYSEDQAGYPSHML